MGVERMIERDIILSLDIGTTNIKLAAIDKTGEVIRLHKRPLRVQCPQAGYHEICPSKLWNDIEDLIRLTSAGLERRIAAIGLSTHRATFTTWERGADHCLHNFITWTDKRTQLMCDEWNSSYVIRLCRIIVWGIGKVVGSSYLTCASNFNVMPRMVQMRLKWVMENIASAKPLYNQGKLCFGTIDTWLIYKLTGNTTLATDYTNAGATGMYNIWRGKWCSLMNWMFSTPIGALPQVLDCNASFGHVSSKLNLGFSVPIHGVLADQQASVFGNHLSSEGDVKLSLGTTISCKRVTGSHVQPLAVSVFPQIAWKLRNEDICYMAESQTVETRGKYLDWLVSAKLVKEIEDIDTIAISVKSSETPFFIKKDGINDEPIQDFMLEKTSNCTDAHFVRAVIEAHAFRSKVLLDDVFEFYDQPGKIIVDGGASSSRFILESLSALTGRNVYRSDFVDGALMGAFLVAGLGLGWWKSLEDIISAKKLTQISPLKEDESKLSEKFEKWKTLLKSKC